MKEATNTDVSSIDVVVERPEDNARLTDSVRSNNATESITGSGGSDVLVTNNSDGNWYLEAVSVTALGVSTAGTVVVDVSVRNANDTVLIEQTIDVTENQANFGGVIVKPEWDIHYAISQDDTNTYNVNIKPLLRKPQPGSPTGGSGEGGTTTETSVIDSFEDAGLGEYTGDTGAYSVVTADSYHLDSSLELTGTTSFSAIQSSSGLENYPSEGDTFAWEQKVSTTTGGDMRTNGVFNIEDADNTWAIRTNYQDDAVLFLETIGGTTNIIEIDYFSALDASEWHSMQVNWESDKITTLVSTPDGRQGSVEVATADLSRDTGHGGWGWGGRIHTGSEHVRFDNARLIE